MHITMHEILGRGLELINHYHILDKIVRWAFNGMWEALVNRKPTLKRSVVTRSKRIRYLQASFRFNSFTLNITFYKSHDSKKETQP